MGQSLPGHGEDFWLLFWVMWEGSEQMKGDTGELTVCGSKSIPLAVEERFGQDMGKPGGPARSCHSGPGRR